MCWIRPVDNVTWVEIKIIKTHSQPAFYGPFLTLLSPPPPVLQVTLRFLFLPQMCMRVRWATRTWCWAGPSLTLEAGSRSPSVWNGSDLLSLPLVLDHHWQITDQTVFLRIGTPPPPTTTTKKISAFNNTSSIRQLPWLENCHRKNMIFFF